MRKSCVLAVDMGGTFLKYACITPDGKMIGRIGMAPSRSGEDRNGVLSAWDTAIRDGMKQSAENGYEISGVGVGTPGPFDYSKKISLMRHKFQSIYGINLADAIRERTDLPPSVAFGFVQDANAFLAGEHMVGAARGIDNCTLVTIGTGLGFSAMAEGRFLSNGYGSCYVALFRQPCQDGIIEDVVSGRGISAAYAALKGSETVTAKEVGIRAEQGDTAAVQIMEHMGRELGRAVGFHMLHTHSQLLVVGGQISKSFNLFSPTLIQSLEREGYTGSVTAAQHPDAAALYGISHIMYGGL